MREKGKVLKDIKTHLQNYILVRLKKQNKKSAKSSNKWTIQETGISRMTHTVWLIRYDSSFSLAHRTVYADTMILWNRVRQSRNAIYFPFKQALQNNWLSVEMTVQFPPCKSSVFLFRTEVQTDLFRISWVFLLSLHVESINLRLNDHVLI